MAKSSGSPDRTNRFKTSAAAGVWKLIWSAPVIVTRCLQNAATGPLTTSYHPPRAGSG